MTKDDETKDDDEFGFSPEFFGFDPGDESDDDVSADDASMVAALFSAALPGQADEPESSVTPMSVLAAARAPASTRKDAADQARIADALDRARRRRRWTSGLLAAAAVVALGVITVPALIKGAGSNTASPASAVSTSAAASSGAAQEQAYSQGDSNTRAPAGGGAEAPTGAPSAAGSSAAASSAAESSAASAGSSSSAASSEASRSESSGSPPLVGPTVPATSGAAAPTSGSRSGQASGGQGRCAWEPLPGSVVSAARAAVGQPTAATAEPLVAPCSDGIIGGAVLPKAGSRIGLTIQVVVAPEGACRTDRSCLTSIERDAYKAAGAGVVVYGDGFEVRVTPDLPIGASVTQEELIAAARAVLDAVR